MLDLRIVGGTIVDGSGAKRFLGDLGIRDGRIVAIGTVDEPASRTIDATGNIVAPGFVDIHTHYDVQVFWDPTLSPSCYHGVTTIIGGYCGFSVAPLSEESGAYLMPMLARVEGMPLECLQAATDWSWSSFADYLSRFEGTVAINTGFLAGHCAIRRYVMGPDAIAREATPAEIEAMKELLRESIRGGALGFSSTRAGTHNDGDGNPVPSRHASREEILALYSVVSEFEGTTAEYLPSIDFDESTYTMLTDVSLAAQRPVNWNAMGVASNDENERRVNAYRLGAGDYARERGAEVIALAVPVGGAVRINLYSGFVFDAFPGWDALFRMPVSERVEKLREPAYRAELKRGAENGPEVIQRIARWERLQVVEVFSEENARYAGRPIADIAAEQDRDAFDVFLDIALADGLRTSFMPQVPEDSAELYKARVALLEDTRTIAGASDAGAHLDMIDSCLYTTRFLAHAVRAFGAMSLEQAVRHLSAEPARLVGIRERGMLKRGWHADIVVFDEAAVGHGPVYTREDLPAGGARLYGDAEGIRHVIVNGVEIIRDNAYLGAPAGKVLRPGEGTYTVDIPAARSSVKEPSSAGAA
jgi:N-acyl-D-aspartate/D-glutamate deacylase